MYKEIWYKSPYLFTANKTLSENQYSLLSFHKTFPGLLPTKLKVRCTFSLAEQLIEQIKAQADNMQQLEINETELNNLQQKEVADDGEEKKKKFQLPQIEIPDKVKIFLLALFKQVSVTSQKKNAPLKPPF